MKARALAAFALLAISVWLAPNAQADDAATRKEFEDKYTAMAQAFEKQDMNAVTAVLHPDFKYEDLLGKQTGKDEWLNSLKNRLDGVQELKVAATVNDLKVEGDTAKPIVAVKITGTISQDGKMVPLEAIETFRDTWAKTPEGWKRKLVRLVLQSTRVDKRLVRPTFTPEADAVRKTIQPLYDAISDIYVKRDWTTLEKGMGENLNATDASGKALTKKELIERIKNGAKNLNDPIMTISIQQVSLESTNATIVRTMTLLADFITPDGNKARMRYVNSTRDVFTKMGTNWVSKSSAELHSEAYLDGKLVPLSAIGGI